MEKEVCKCQKKYGSILHVWMHNLSKIDLGHRRLWIVLDKEIELYEHTEFTSYGDSWLRTFLDAQNKAGFFVTDSNFIPLLKQFLNQTQFAKYSRDVILDESVQKLEACRVPIRLRYVGFSNQSRAMILFRQLAKGSSLPTSVYADFFLFAEQYSAVLPGTLSSIVIAGVAVTLVSLLLIPEPMAAFWVSFSILSINLGVLGFMSMWSVRLDFISMVTIVMSIGFCVDFAAHLAHSFAKGKNVTSAQRLRNAMYTVGTPILQSGSSTILGVSFLASTETYIFRSFLKTIVLVIVLGVFHGLVVLPVLLTTFYSDQKDNASLDEVRKNYPTEIRDIDLRSRQLQHPLSAHTISHPLPNTACNSFRRSPSNYMDELLRILFNQSNLNDPIQPPHFSTNDSAFNANLAAQPFRVCKRDPNILSLPPRLR
uniref:Uncharacterized protein n=1 Tax=Ditylenchus dipsaci TaxID=166011 RepID=A0A915E557_9BILA